MPAGGAVGITSLGLAYGALPPAPCFSAGQALSLVEGPLEAPTLVAGVTSSWGLLICLQHKYSLGKQPTTGLFPAMRGSLWVQRVG